MDTVKRIDRIDALVAEAEGRLAEAAFKPGPPTDMKKAKERAKKLADEAKVAAHTAAMIRENLLTAQEILLGKVKPESVRAAKKVILDARVALIQLARSTAKLNGASTLWKYK